MSGEFAAVALARADHRYPERRPLRQVLNSLVGALGLLLLGVSGSEAHEAKDGVSRTLLAKAPLADFPNHVMTALEIELAPGEVVAPHRHGGFVYVYLLKGRVRSQLGDEPPQDFEAGQNWIEPAGVLHTLTENLSATETAKVLAIIFSETGAAITTPVTRN